MPVMDELLKVAGAITPGSAAALAVVGVLTGWLIPRWTYRSVVRSKDAEIAYLRKDRVELVDVVQKLMVTGDLIRTTMTALPTAPKDPSPPTDGHV